MIEKVRSKNGEFLSETKTQFIWDGSHLVQEINHKTDRTFSYIYSHPNSYEPLAQICTEYKGEETQSETNAQHIHYFHCDQIGAPREMTDEAGNLLWYADYKGWGGIREAHNLKDAHQPFRLQNQYVDEETGLHYNLFRYYDPHIGRFTQQDPIGLAGGNNLYRFEGTVQNQVDPTGLNPLVIGGYEAFMYLLAVTGIYTIAVNSQDDGTVWSTSNDEESQSSNQSTTDISNCSKTETGCPPCSPYPVGTLGYQGPEAHLRGTFAGREHYHIFEVQQNPNDCKCRWQKGSKSVWSHQYFGDINPSWINLNSSPNRPPNYPH